MKVHFRYLLTSMTSIAALGLGACASGPQKVEFAADTNPQAKVVELRERMKTDQAKQFDRLSPDNFEEAGKSLARAQHEIDQNEPSESVLSDAGKAAARLQIVENNANQHSAELAPALTARQAALDARAPQTNAKDFAAADRDLTSYGKDIENGNFHPDSKEVSQLESKYSDVELKAVKATTLGEAKGILERADNNGGKNKAPLTFNAAQAQYDSALRSVEANRRNPTGYRPSVAAALTGAHKLDQVLATIGSSRTSEAAAVKIYDQQQQLAATQQSLDQAKTDTQIANANTQAAENQVANEKQNVSALQGQNNEYATKAANNQKIADIKAEFSPEEADVLRDGNNIILRLKTMKFSTARYELTQSSLSTLQKVKEMIAAVPFSKVVVEGHTDNVGGEKKNLALSQDRAETVKKYLVAEGSVPDAKIEAHGFGYEKPLTSNKTAQGRATNRRVDVVINTDANL